MATPSPAFPAAVATDATLKVANNLIETKLRVAIDAANTALFVNSTAGFVPNCLVSIDKEIIAIADIVDSPNPMLVVAAGGRAFDGTTAAPHAAGARVAMLIDAWHHNVLATEIKAIEAFIGPNGQNLASGIYGQVISADYNFASQAPGDSLAPGNNVITLTPVPLGINGTDLNHWLYISGGTGSAEPVLITGGSAVSGAPSGTVIVNCGQSHSGPWTIRSATSGIDEAMRQLPVDGGVVQIPAGSFPIYATVIIGNGTDTARSTINSISIKGRGYGRGADMAFPLTAATMLVWSGVAGGTVMRVRGPIGQVLLEDFMIDGNASAAIGLEIIHSYYSAYKRVNVRNWTTIGIRCVPVDYAFAAMVNGANENHFEQVMANDPAGTSSTAIAFQAGLANLPANSVFAFASNLLTNCYIRCDKGTGLELNYADHNSFIMSTIESANGTALRFKGAGPNFPNSNYFFNSAIVGPTIAVPADFNPAIKNCFWPLTSSESTQNPYDLQRFAIGIDDNTTQLFGFHKNVPLYYANTTSPAAIANSSAELAFARSFTVPAYVMHLQGTTVRIRCSGRYTTSGTPTLTFLIKIGTVNIGQFILTAANNAAGFAFACEVDFTVGVLGTGGSAFRGFAMGVFSGTPVVGNATGGGFSLNTITVNTITCAAQWGTASPSNSIILDAFAIEIEHPGAIE